MRPLDALTIPLHGTRLIEASAGTGKTYTIANLYLRLLLELRLQVGQILVVTYTNAATAELRARVRERLREAVSAWGSNRSSPGDEFLDRLLRQRQQYGSTEPDCAQLLLALNAFDEAAILTIHGFCQRVLQEHAFESGVFFDAELIADQGPLLAEVVQDFWIRELHDAPAGFIRHLQNADVTPGSLQYLAAKIAANPDMPVLPERSAADFRHLEEALPGGGDRPAFLEARALKLQLDLAAYVRQELPRRKQLARSDSFDDLLHRLAGALRGFHGDALAAMVRQHFHAALIDEFQDTDPVQYDIFRRLYAGTPAPLFLIADPKQAIYAFRGADVFAYMQAKRDARSEPYTLTVNRRSDPSLVQAVSALFTRARLPFVFPDISCPAVVAGPEARDRLGGAAAGQAPLEILFVPRTDRPGQVNKRNGVINKAWGEDALTNAVASEIVRLLHAGVTIADRRVTPGDIAVLCRKNRQAGLMQEALRRRGVPSVLHTEASVFETAEAEEVERVLRAMADPADGGAIRAALATIMLGEDASALSNLDQDAHRWDEWVGRLQAWHDLWARRGFVTAFRGLLEAQAVAARLLRLHDGERRLTNVLHLMELLHAASAEERRGPQALVHWLNQMRINVEARAPLASEAAQIRLESDAAAVQLTTVHKSKGLEYSIVYCPYLWDGSLLSADDKRALRFHDVQDGHVLKLDIGSAEFAAHLAAAEREALAENLRLLYVALSRARHRCTVVWGLFNSAETSALGYLLHQNPDAVGDPAAQAYERLRSFRNAPADDGMRADLAAVIAAANGGIAVRDLPPENGDRYRPSAQGPSVLRCRTLARPLQQTWKVTSFSALVSSGLRITEPAEEGLDRDATLDTPSPEQPPRRGAATLVKLHDFPVGTRAGQFLHDVLQRLDFHMQDTAGLRQSVATALARFGFAENWLEPLCGTLADVMATPLDERAGLRLGDITMSQRLNELEFIFPIFHGAAGGQAYPQSALLTRERLAEAFARHAVPPVSPEYPHRLRQLGFAPLNGFLKGFIDLAFVHQGRWYIVDYKSNFLGSMPDDYQPSRLLHPMAEHHYFLQYHLYVVALHRHLNNRLPDYDYDRHFGGVYYLFLRGMAPDHGRAGIFADRPGRALIEALSAALGGHSRARR